jgi:hypothetical protein
MNNFQKTLYFIRKVKTIKNSHKENKNVSMLNINIFFKRIFLSFEFSYEVKCFLKNISSRNPKKNWNC